MTRRGRRAVLLIAAGVTALFAGQWLTRALADIWWGSAVSPGAGPYLLRLHVTRGLLDAAGVLLSSLWFGFHLVIVFRAIGSVQVPRHLANVEFRETLTPRVLLAGTVLLGVLLGLVVGTSASELWAPVALAWQGVEFGAVDPVLGHELGFYVAQLPLRLALQSAALVLVLVALAGTLTLYVVIGAVRWIDRRPAVNGHARTHLGWLLATLAAVLAWGYSLHPPAVVAGLDGPLDPGVIRAARVVAPALVGTALMVALLSAIWAVRPRHLLALAAWLVLGLAWLGGRLVVPAALRSPDAATVAGPQLEALLAHAYGVGGLETRTYGAGRGAAARAPVALWTDSLAAAAAGAAADGSGAGRTLAQIGEVARPAWVVVRAAPDRLVVTVLADDRVSASGAPLFYRPADTLAHPLAEPWLELDEPAVRPGAPRYVVSSRAPGIRTGGWLRRAALAWALQAPALLGRQPGDGRVAWRLDPRDRVAGVAPFALWDEPAPRLVGDRLVWLLHGTVVSTAFPLVPRVSVGGGEAGLVRSGLLAVVDAASGAVRIHLRPDADPLSRAWAAIAGGTVEPWERLEAPLRESAGYPEPLFRAQAQALARGQWAAAGTGAILLYDDSASVGLEAWPADGSGPIRTAAYVAESPRRLGAVLVGGDDGDRRRLELLVPDTGAMLATPRVLANDWSRFPLFEQLQDSVAAAGGRLTAGPVRFWLGGEALGAYRAHVGTGAGGRPSLVWLSLARPDRLAAGRDEPEALENLAGTGVPAPFAAPGQTPMDEARRWMRLADSAFRRGDLDAFARAWDGLRATLEPPADTGADQLVGPPEQD